MSTFWGLALFDTPTGDLAPSDRQLSLYTEIGLAGQGLFSLFRMTLRPSAPCLCVNFTVKFSESNLIPQGMGSLILFP